MHAGHFAATQQSCFSEQLIGSFLFARVTFLLGTQSSNCPRLLQDQNKKSVSSQHSLDPTGCSVCVQSSRRCVSRAAAAQCSAQCEAAFVITGFLVSVISHA
jgi:hypothetical protein